MWIRITPRRRAILMFIKDYVERNGYSPTFREILGATDITSTSVLNHNIARLIEAGLLKQRKDSIRGFYDVIIPNSDAVIAKHLTANARRKRSARAALFSDLEQFGGRCAYCGREDAILERDHFFPVALGGSDGPHNLLPACRECNQKKTASEPVAWVLENYGRETLERIIAYLHSRHPRKQP